MKSIHWLARRERLAARTPDAVAATPAAPGDNAHLPLVLAGLPALLYYIDTGMRYRYASGGYRHLLSIDPATLIGRHIREVFDDSDFEEMLGPLQRAFAGEPQHFVRAQRRSGNPRFYKVDYFPDRDADGRVVGLYGVSLDITEAHRAELHIAELNRRVQHLVDRLPAAIAYFADADTAIFINTAYRQLATGEAADGPDAFGRMLDAFGVPGRRQPAARAALLGTQQALDTEVLRDGAPCALHVVLIPDHDAAGEQVGVIGLATDVTDFKRISDEFQRLARTDALTGLPNRRSAEERIDDALRRAPRGRQGWALVAFDLDNFKPVNDQHGHEAGDAVLQEVARRASALVRQTDAVARLGGDEFQVVLEHLDGIDGALRVAHKLVEALARPVAWQGRLLQVGASAGLAYVPPASSGTRREVLAAADRLLYEAKRAGKNTVRSGTV